MSDARQITINDFLTKDEIARAVQLYRDTKGSGSFARSCAANIITPVMGRINKALGQENDATYLAYMVEYVFMRSNI